MLGEMINMPRQKPSVVTLKFFKSNMRNSKPWWTRNAQLYSMILKRSSKLCACGLCSCSTQGNWLSWKLLRFSWANAGINLTFSKLWVLIAPSKCAFWERERQQLQKSLYSTTLVRTSYTSNTSAICNSVMGTQWSQWTTVWKSMSYFNVSIQLQNHCLVTHLIWRST